MKTLILCYSYHHCNTRKLVDAIAARFQVDIADLAEEPLPDMAGYDCIGFASGIYNYAFHNTIMKAAAEIPAGKRAFFLYTCGDMSRSHTGAIRRTLEKRGTRILGEYGCYGFDTAPLFKSMGGIRKGHPNAEEIAGAAAFYEKILG